MNPDDQNQNSTPASEPTAPTPAEPVGQGEPMGGGAEPAAPAETQTPEQPAGEVATNCHCGRASSSGTCTGCNQPEAGCNCTPAA